jgi:hypothetical protein
MHAISLGSLPTSDAQGVTSTTSCENTQICWRWFIEHHTHRKINIENSGGFSPRFSTASRMGCARQRAHGGRRRRRGRSCLQHQAFHRHFVEHSQSMRNAGLQGVAPWGGNSRAAAWGRKGSKGWRPWTGRERHEETRARAMEKGRELAGANADGALRTTGKKPTESSAASSSKGKMEVQVGECRSSTPAAAMELCSAMEAAAPALA